KNCATFIFEREKNLRATMVAMCRLMFLSLLVLWDILHISSAYKDFQSLIPNGGRVVDPCNNQSTWEGVGHLVKEGRSKRNSFGLDFYTYGKSWTKAFCTLDSDGDGRSNGEELGDPDCVWKPGNTPRRPSLSHPGICEPLTSELCKAKNQGFSCNVASNLEMGFCPHLDKSSIITKELRMAETQVPPSETSYFCQLFDLNFTTDHHMVATQPMVHVKSVVHHVLLFGCDPRVETETSLRSPYQCDMVPHTACNSLIGAWTIGSPGECAHPEMGFRMGPRGYRTVALQVHWNNPNKKSEFVDMSGLKIFLTTKLRKHDAGMLVIGQNYLQIDPETDQGTTDKSKLVEFSSVCPERCTQVMFQTPIFVTSAVNHMHYLGKGQHIKVYKNNTLHSVITDQDNYKYDDPVIYNFQTPIRIEPGDELRTTCVYKRTPKKTPVCWGEATSSEMCFGFITYFPLLRKLSQPWCTSHKSLPSCDRHLPSLSTRPIGNCKWWEFRNASHPETQAILGRVFQECYPSRDPVLRCTDGCKEIVNLIASHPCLQVNFKF
ncbi:unnamed protein product, partial [Lymnaea stagnalis]